MSHVVGDTARSELGSMINMTVLLLSQLFESAEEQDAILEMDVAAIENQRLLEEVEKMSLNKSENTKAKGMRLKDSLAQTKKELMQAESDRDLAQGKYKSASKKYKREAEKSTKLEEELAVSERRRKSPKTKTRRRGEERRGEERRLGRGEEKEEGRGKGSENAQ